MTHPWICCWYICIGEHSCQNLLNIMGLSNGFSEQYESKGHASSKATRRKAIGQNKQCKTWQFRSESILSRRSSQYNLSTLNRVIFDCKPIHTNPSDSSINGVSASKSSSPPMMTEATCVEPRNHEPTRSASESRMLVKDRYGDHLEKALLNHKHVLKVPS